MKTLRKIGKHDETVPCRRQARKASAAGAAPTARFVRGLGCALALCLGLVGSGCSRNAEFNSVTRLLSRSQAENPLTGEQALLLNHVQLKGSHNSYHQAPRMAVAKGWRYSHLPLEKQLEVQGVRQIELDVRYSGGEVVVGHLPFLDGRSSCRTLKACLERIHGWSSEHPNHLPIFVFIEPKEHVSPSNLHGRMEVLDNTIASVFPSKSLITPEDVAGDAPSLQEAIKRHGWPTLEASRGKVMFVLFGRDSHTRSYAHGRPRLDGRLMFATGKPGEPHAAIASFDNPVSGRRDIAEALSLGMLVRTRADSDLRRDERRRDAALESGAHFIGSDFVDPKLGWLDLGPRTPARCNPRQGHESCVSAALREDAPGSMIALEQHTDAPSPTRADIAPAVQAASSLHDATLSNTALPSVEAMP